MRGCHAWVRAARAPSHVGRGAGDRGCGGGTVDQPRQCCQALFERIYVIDEDLSPGAIPTQQTATLNAKHAKDAY